MDNTPTFKSVNIQELNNQARDILRKNDKRNYTVPTVDLYPYQWNWDSAVAAYGFSAFDIERAWVELETLFSAQWSNGMVPHIVFHVEDKKYFPGPGVWSCGEAIPSSGITQPPIAISMAKLILLKDLNAGRSRAKALFSKMLAWHNWFIKWRLHQGGVCATHPWESGRDNAPDWDIAFANIDPSDVGEYKRSDITFVESDMRPTKYAYDRFSWLIKKSKALGWNERDMLASSSFRVVDPTLTFTLLRASRDLVAMGKLLGIDVGAIETNTAMLEAGAKTLWNPLGYYDSRDALTGEWSNCLTNASFLCWYAGIPAPEMLTKFKSVMSKTKYGVPSLTPEDTRFDSKRYWRGPVWSVMNMLIGIGMEDMGFDEAKAVKDDTAELINEHGFAEYFDSMSGFPAGGQYFTWTAAVWLSWASPSANKKI